MPTHRSRSASIIAIAALLLFTGGCQTRSISDPGLYSTNRLYEGELTELDVIGAVADHATQSAIAAAAADYRAPTVTRGGRVLLIQSGAVLPDPELVAAFGDTLRLTSVSGVPDDHLGAALRLAAARGGCEAIVCVWGTLETAQRRLGGSAVSWVPFVGWGVPDQEMDTRLRLRFVVVDAVTGNWSAFEPEPSSDTVTTSPFGRGLSDVPDEAAMDQAQRMKRAAFGTAVPALLEKFVRG